MNPGPKGVLGGGQLGFNTQMGAFVWGLETNIQASAINGDITQLPPIGPAGLPTTCYQEVSQKLTGLERYGFARVSPQLIVYCFT